MVESKSSPKLPSMQVLRAIAASLVVLSHVAGYFELVSPRHSWIINSGLGRLGYSGVDIFFVISGFIMVYTTTQKAGAKDAWIFIQRRMLRIYPLYWSITTLFVIVWSTGFALRNTHYSASYLINSYLLIPYFENGSFEPVLSQGWTLSFEMLFYLVFSCVLFLKLKRLKLAFLIGTFAALTLSGRLLSSTSGIRYLITAPIMIEFLYGVLAAEILLRLPTVRDTFYQRMLPVCLICIGAIGLLCTILIPDAFSMRFLYYGIPALLIVFGTAMLGSAPCARQLVYLGDASYSIYLAHLILIDASFRALRHFHLFDQVLPDVFILPATMITIILSSFTYFFFERPLTRALTKKKTPSMLVVA